MEAVEQALRTTSAAGTFQGSATDAAAVKGPTPRLAPSGQPPAASPVRRGDERGVLEPPMPQLETDGRAGDIRVTEVSHHEP
jgi:hypothetical protein